MREKIAAVILILGTIFVVGAAYNTKPLTVVNNCDNCCGPAPDGDRSEWYSCMKACQDATNQGHPPLCDVSFAVDGGRAAILRWELVEGG